MQAVGAQHCPDVPVSTSCAVQARTILPNTNSEAALTQRIGELEAELKQRRRRHPRREAAAAAATDDDDGTEARTERRSARAADRAVRALLKRIGELDQMRPERVKAMRERFESIPREKREAMRQRCEEEDSHGGLLTT